MTNIDKNKNNISLLGLILYSLMPGGQLWCRVFDLNGSLEWSWFLFPLFMMPPFQILPMLLIYFNFIKKGTGSKPADFYMMIPIVTKIALSTILPRIIEDSSLIYWLTELGTLGMITCVKIIRTYGSCSQANKNTDFTIGKLTQSMSDAIYESSMAGIFYSILGLIKFVPLFGLIFMAIDTFVGDTVSLVFWCIGYMFNYVVTNMYNQYDMNEFCDPGIYSARTMSKSTIGLIVFIFSNIVGLLSFKGIAKTGFKSLSKTGFKLLSKNGIKGITESITGLL